MSKPAPAAEAGDPRSDCAPPDGQVGKSALKLDVAERLLALLSRQAAIETRLAALEQGKSSGGSPGVNEAAGTPPPLPPNESDVYRRLHSELVRRGLTEFQLVRVPGPYYDKPLEFRAQRVGAKSAAHMCKTMVMENTRAPADTAATGDPRTSKYFMVLVQYCATIDAQKLKDWVHAVANEVAPISKSKINMRMVPEELSQELTGFGHNAVTPICSATPLPIIMSHRIAELPGLFFLGAGEVDLKVAVRAREFVKGFGDAPVFVVDCTTQ